MDASGLARDGTGVICLEKVGMFDRAKKRPLITLVVVACLAVMGLIGPGKVEAKTYRLKIQLASPRGDTSMETQIERQEGWRFLFPDRDNVFRAHVTLECLIRRLINGKL